ncbi:hypothetical protein [Singulisphaera sp. PoT]|uniref:STN domain-containing protein n=1 Tax=Singulisphaera sp. PoT TaxID=3411797 RepID=UPI003BF46C93
MRNVLRTAGRILAVGSVLSIANAWAEPPHNSSTTTTPARPDRIEDARAIEAVETQHFLSKVAERMDVARSLRSQHRASAALEVLRLAQTDIRGNASLGDGARENLDRRIQAAILVTVRAEETEAQQAAEAMRREIRGLDVERGISALARKQETIGSLMGQFDRLMSEGMASGSSGTTIASNFEVAQRLARLSSSLMPDSPEPRVGSFVAGTTGALTQSLGTEQFQDIRALQSLQESSRAAVSAIDSETVTFIDADTWRARSEPRLRRYARGTSLEERDAKSEWIRAKLEEPVTMRFPHDTPIQDILQYVRSATMGRGDAGIPIYVDPVGLQEADRTLTSTVSIDLEGVPLKTTLRLILKQLGLSYTVKDGLLTITSADSVDTPMEMRAYPMADLAILPSSLVGNHNAGRVGGNRPAGNFGGIPNGFPINGNPLNPGNR